MATKKQFRGSIGIKDLIKARSVEGIRPWCEKCDKFVPKSCAKCEAKK